MGLLLVDARRELIFGAIATQREMKKNNETFSYGPIAGLPAGFA
jgi:hypothetical protein